MFRLHRPHFEKLFFALTLFWALPAFSGAYSVVYPTGIFPDDVNNIQAAVDKGGTVLLKAVNKKGVPTEFNFSTDLLTAYGSGFINLSADVKIIGEVAAHARTTIRGGFGPIEGLSPVKSSIQGIDFESPFSDAIDIATSNGSTEITGNVIHNVVPVRVRVPDGNIISFADGIDFYGGSDYGIVAGKVRLVGNVIDGLGAIFSNGVQLDTVQSDVEITGNLIQNVNSPDTEQGGGITLVRLQKSALVSANLVIPGPSATSFADGIFIGGDLSARYKVISNLVYSTSYNGDGIDIAGGDATGTTGTIDAVVAFNQVTTLSAPNAIPIALYDLVTNSLITGNDLRGEGYAGLMISTYGFDTEVTSGNRFLGNDLSHFKSDFADVFFDANGENNTVLGQCNSVVDLGTGNTIRCTLHSAAQMKSPAAPRFSVEQMRKIQRQTVHPLVRNNSAGNVLQP
ncbi:Parallel beta-helix repeat protein [Candidatus Koribacter versatilis Ellin345]|uniref:Parallel beta-helix repeat protein n=1 Tax=Koribacter versatilis (strain Ellin345) TaxID=204669 RepID=Q1IVK1_KORVE|nr:hypothetical protein [Candidatus Koribacter versatilis]ABF39099.1 Parallel beta-helix repeat protein [Candidatus Koribacter versatilis Ellin345]